MGVIVAVGAAAIAGAWIYRRSQEPAVASAEVQREGLAKVRRILVRVSASPFGRSRRGGALTRAVRELLAADRIVFTAQITAQGKYVDSRIGSGTMYVRVFRLREDVFMHQQDDGIAEAIYHEAVHVLRPGSTCIEEECDGYAAGLVAGAAMRGETPPEILRHDGVSVAQFVLRAYRDLPRNAGYQPVERDREWLARRTGLAAAAHGQQAGRPAE